ncbi:DUF5050 domain-containing protein [Hathewaya histolytica]|uniref:Leucine rich repeat protein n=1 Tax=Hathewaya histolytica TaxID=1498 RepID=A0A4U9RBY6_HATHI|nr:DUF5050 domain-containing protein [Hathewaya histolytica]VTQ89245.1 leucine rich repeat protein [Hathewaya histolytica]
MQGEKEFFKNNGHKKIFILGLISLVVLATVVHFISKDKINKLELSNKDKPKTISNSKTDESKGSSSNLPIKETDTKVKKDGEKNLTKAKILDKNIANNNTTKKYREYSPSTSIHNGKGDKSSKTSEDKISKYIEEKVEDKSSDDKKKFIEKDKGKDIKREFNSKLYVYGNSTGNSMNYSELCYDGNYIYYSRDNDKGKIYRTKDGYKSNEKVTNISGRCINIVGDWVYFLGSDISSNSRGIWKIRKDGSNAKKISNDYPVQMVVVNDYIYYSLDLGDQTSGIFKIKTNGTNRENVFLQSNNITLSYGYPKILVYKDLIYFNGTDYTTLTNGVWRIGTNGKALKKVLNFDSSNFLVSDNHIFHKKIFQ